MSENIVYQGQFGEYTIDRSDRIGVIVYRAGMAIAALSVAVGGFLFLGLGATPTVLSWLTVLFFTFSAGLGISLATIHIYLIPLHRLLQLFWAIGTLSAAFIVFKTDQPLALYIYNNPLSLLGVGFIFAALTGIYFKEAFCFNRIETQVLVFIVPALFLGHLIGFVPVDWEKVLLDLWLVLFIVFAARKSFQEIPPDIGDKSVFDYLKKQKATSNTVS